MSTADPLSTMSLSGALHDVGVKRMEGKEKIVKGEDTGVSEKLVGGTFADHTEGLTKA